MDISEIKSIIECTICLDINRGHIHQCKNGHIVCAKCHPKVKNKCPIGGCGAVKGRSLVAENIRNGCNLEFACVYEDEGCNI